MNKKIILASALLAVLIASMVTIPFAYADSAGPRSGTTFAGNIGITSGDFNWSDASNAASSNDSYATAIVTGSTDISNYLRATGFGFSVPSNAVIQGIEVGIERSEGNTQTATIFDNVVSLVKNNIVTGQDKGTATAWPTADATATYGSASDLWSTTWTASDINNANFGVVLSVGRTSGGDEIARVDHMTITVTYYIPETAGPQSSTSAAGNIAISGGDHDWNNAGNIATSNNQRADVTIIDNDNISNYLRATGFGFSIPSTATIRGISVGIERTEGNLGNAEIQDNVVSLVKNNAVTGNNKAATTTNWPTADATATYGSSTDLWGTTWTPSDINNANFGVVLSVQTNSDTDESARVDYISITVTYSLPPNTTPTADVQSVNTNEDTSLPITLTGNANDAGQTLTFEIVTNPTHGTLTEFNSATGAVTYNPTLDFNGADSFTFRVNDGFENSSSATVSITVDAVNDAPTASNTSTSTNEDTPVTLTLSATDIDSGSVTFSIVSGPSSGSLDTITPTDSLTATVQYTPDGDFNGSDSFTFKANDGSADSNTTTASITVNAVNDNPTVNDDSAATDEDTSVDVAVLANDNDVDGDTFSVTAASDPANGSAIVNVDNTVTYTPDADFNGADSFTYDVSDGNGGTATATANVTVQAVNDAPVANDDSATTDEDNSVNIDVIANDTDVEGNSLDVTSVTSPSNGSAQIELDGTVTYIPNADFVGTDTFDYVVSDGSLTDTGTVTVTISQVNDNPVAADDSIETDEDTPFTVDVLANDSDIEGDTFTVSSVGAASNGDAVNNGDGTVTYTPDVNFNGSDSFTYDISDGNGGTASATVNVTVNSVNDAPVASDDNATTDEDNSVNIDVMANDSDVEGDSLQVTSTTTPANGSVQIESDGTVTYTPNADFNGSDTFDYVVSDGLLDDTGTVTVTVNAINDNPVANDDSGTTDEDVAVTVDVLANDSDVEGDSLSVSAVGTASDGSVVNNGDGTVTYTPTPDFNGADSFSYTISDGNGGTASASVAITVSAVNDAPVADDQSVSTDEDTQVAITLTASDVENDSLVYSIVSGPSSGTLSGTAPDLTYAPDSNFNGVDSFTFKANDGSADSNTATVTITVGAVNDQPTADNQSVTTDEDTQVSITLTGSDTEDGTSLAYTVASSPTNGTLSGTAPDLTYTPNADFNGSDSFTFKVTDGETLDSTDATVSITVNAVNDAPVSNDNIYSTDEDTLLSVTPVGVLANDSDVDGDAITAAQVSDPLNGVLTLNPDGSFEYTPNADFNGSDSFTYDANDGSADGNVATVTIAVNAVNDAPVANNDSATTDEDIPVSMEVLANDSDIDSSSLTVSIESMPSDGTATVNPDNTITYTPNADFNGPDSFQYRLSDGSLEVVAQVDITVGPVNDAPVANDDIDSVQEDDSVTTNVVANDGDTENETLAVTITSSPSNGVATENGDGTVTYTPNANFNGADSYQYTVNDGNADSNTATVTITIAPVNDAPVAADDADSTAEDTAVTTDVLANDTDLDGDSLTVSSTGPAGDGSVVNNGDGTVTYIPTPDFNGPDSFVYTIDDGNGGTATATVYVEISSVNDTPVADDQSVSTDEDTPVSITLTGSDVDGNSLTFNIVDQPTNGTLSGTAPDLTYTPNADFNGSDSFTLTVNDGNADSSIATVSITVNAANDQPTADNQSVTTDEDTQVSITLTGSDTEDGTSLTYSLTSSPASGILSGTAPDLAYTPNANFNGADEFKFKVTDSESLESTEATVSITVNSVNDNPVANDDSGSTAEDTPVTIDVLANDLDVDGNSLFVESVSTATDGSVVNNGDGTVTYTPNVDFAGADFFTYNINDGNGGTATATVTVSVGGVNDSPTVNDDSETTSEDTPVTMSVLVNDGDIDGDSLTVTSTSDPTNGSAVVNIDNTVTYTPNANFNGSDSFTYDVSDGNGGTATATVNISVSAVNDAPVALDTSEVVDEDGTLFLTVSASDIDGDSLTFEVVSDPANGVLTGSGPDYTYTPNPDFTGSDSFTFKANDGSTDSNTTTVSITVQGPTDATRPLVSISSPANGGSINGPTSGVTVNLSGTASDSGSGIQIVEVRTETSGYSTVTTSDGYATWTKSITFKTAGAHQLVARATDNAGNMQWHVINVDIAMTVDVTRPVVTVTIPVNGNTLSGPAGAVVVDVSGTSSDFNTGVQIVEVRTDASAYSSATTSDGYSTWTKSVTFTTTGSHQIVARATDNAGNMQWHVINVDIVFTP